MLETAKLTDIKLVALILSHDMKAGLLMMLFHMLCDGSWLNFMLTCHNDSQTLH